MFNTPCPSLVASRFLLLAVQLYCTVSDRKLGMETGLPRPLCVCQWRSQVTYNAGAQHE